MLDVVSVLSAIMRHILMFIASQEFCWMLVIQTAFRVSIITTHFIPLRAPQSEVADFQNV